MKNILIYGLQRSGTNFLEKLLLKNYSVNILNDNDDRKSPLQKHFRLYDDKMYIPTSEYFNDMKFIDFSEYENVLNLSNKIDGILIIYKDPYSWLLSYKNWAKKQNWPSVNYHYIEEYSRFYEKWLEFSNEDPRIVFVNYIDLLSKTDLELKKIENIFNLKLLKVRYIFGKQYNFKLVGRSKWFNNAKRNYYLNKEYLKEYDKNELELIRFKVNNKFLK